MPYSPRVPQSSNSQATKAGSSARKDRSLAPGRAIHFPVIVDGLSSPCTFSLPRISLRETSRGAHHVVSIVLFVPVSFSAVARNQFQRSLIHHLHTRLSSCLSYRPSLLRENRVKRNSTHPVTLARLSAANASRLTLVRQIRRRRSTPCKRAYPTEASYGNAFVSLPAPPGILPLRPCNTVPRRAFPHPLGLALSPLQLHTNRAHPHYARCYLLIFVQERAIARRARFLLMTYKEKTQRAILYFFSRIDTLKFTQRVHRILSIIFIKQID